MLLWCRSETPPVQCDCVYLFRHRRSCTLSHRWAHQLTQAKIIGLVSGREGINLLWRVKCWEKSRRVVMKGYYCSSNDVPWWILDCHCLRGLSGWSPWDHMPASPQLQVSLGKPERWNEIQIYEHALIDWLVPVVGPGPEAQRRSWLREVMKYRIFQPVGHWSAAEWLEAPSRPVWFCILLHMKSRARSGEVWISLQQIKKQRQVNNTLRKFKKLFQVELSHCDHSGSFPKRKIQNHLYRAFGKKKEEINDMTTGNKKNSSTVNTCMP